MGNEQSVAPTRDDKVVQSLSEVVGGPMGSRSGGHRWIKPVSVLMMFTALTFALGMWQKTNCYNDAWRDSTARMTHMCYSDLPYLYTGRGMVEGAWPYSNDEQVRARYPEVMEYPVGISYWAWATAEITLTLSGADLDARAQQAPADIASDPKVVEESQLYVVVNAVGLGALAILTTWFLAGVNRRRPWDAAGFALAPTLALAALVNWDLLAVVFVAAALWAWARGSTSQDEPPAKETLAAHPMFWPAISGLMIGLGTAAKLYPMFLLGGILVICLRQRKLGQFAVATLTAVVSWFVANLPAMATGMEEWKHFWSFNDERGADLGSVWLVISHLQGGVELSTVNNISLLFFAVWCVGVLALGWSSPITPRLAQLGLLIVIGFLLINKVYSPQYVLWILPLAALARPRWRDLLIWQAGEVFYFAMVWWYLGDFLKPGSGDQVVSYWLAIALRILAELYLVAVVVRDMYRVDADPAGSERETWSERQITPDSTKKVPI